ncbi:MAG: molybdopterin molybdotransferase MoeA [Xanthobacteraceae bacterium]|nr:molybdopterin molybdotransferase MoeA [Xanthobacteraceae bacterium]MCW5677248.1 molybdopterin molybdotransferase MoeA [Xanthobacteraceae bacterium]
MKSPPLVPVTEALAKVVNGAKPLPSENVPLNLAANRVLAADVKALRSQPPFDVSAMDGYAARTSDLAANKPLKLVGESAAGHRLKCELQAGEAARIFTGAVVPGGADVIVEQESAKRDGDLVTLPAYEAGKNIRAAGVDFREGDVILKKGLRLSARAVGLAAAMDHATLVCAKRPRVAILSTGDELVAPGAGGPPERIVASNHFSVAALCEQEGAEVVDARVLKDKLDLISEAIEGAKESADVIVTLGGASVGEHDLIRPALDKAGAVIDFHRIALRPGKPTLSGGVGPARVLGLPGNPVSTFVCSVIFLVPLLRKLQGMSEPVQKPLPAILGEDVWENDQRADFIRSVSRYDDEGRRVVMPFLKKSQDSSFTSVLAKADCLLIRAAGAPAAKKGERCEIIPLD